MSEERPTVSSRFPFVVRKFRPGANDLGDTVPKWMEYQALWELHALPWGRRLGHFPIWIEWLSEGEARVICTKHIGPQLVYYDVYVAGAEMPPAELLKLAEPKQPFNILDPHRSDTFASSWVGLDSTRLNPENPA